MSKADDMQTRTEAFADLSIQFVQGLPKTLIAQRMGTQFLEASTSVATNYRAARRGRSYAEFASKLGVVSEEADESVFWLKRFKNANIVGAIAVDSLLAEPEELARIFGASAHTARRRRRRRE